MTDADWLAAVAAAPDDPLVRLAYADWLYDRGDPRGELLRLDVALAGGADPAAAARLAEVSAGVPLGWRAAVCRVPQAGAAGDFYQLDLCMCGGPEAAAPELFGPPGTGFHTPRRLPSGRAEVERMCAAVRACERHCLRYGGFDPVVIQLLGDGGDYCDHSLDWTPPAPPSPAPQVYAARAPGRPSRPVLLHMLAYTVLPLGVGAAVVLVAGVAATRILNK